jgi:hypothetical protein
MALGLTQPLTEMSTRDLPGGKWRPERGTDNLTATCEPLSRKCGGLDVSTPWAFTAHYRDCFTLPYLIYSTFCFMKLPVKFLTEPFLYSTYMPLNANSHLNLLSLDIELVGRNLNL